MINHIYHSTRTKNPVAVGRVRFRCAHEPPGPVDHLPLGSWTARPRGPPRPLAVVVAHTYYCYAPRHPAATHILDGHTHQRALGATQVPELTTQSPP